MAWCRNYEGDAYGLKEVQFPITFNKIYAIHTCGAKSYTLFTDTSNCSARVTTHSDYNDCTLSSVNVQKRVGHRIFIVGY